MKQFPGDWFAYSELDIGERPPQLAPLITLIVEFRGRQLSSSGLIDTGSDVTILPSGFAHRLGIDDTLKDATVGTLGGEVPAARAVVGLRIALTAGDLHVPAAAVLVVDSGDTMPVIVVGRKPMLVEAELRLQEWNARFTLVRRQRAWLEFPQPALRRPPSALLGLRNRESSFAANRRPSMAQALPFTAAASPPARSPQFSARAPRPPPGTPPRRLHRSSPR